jgi:hypothetical protein
MHTRNLISALSITIACVTTQAAAQRGVVGHWRVTHSMCPTECAMSRTEADTWRGRIATYSDTLAQFAEHSCHRPRYVVGYWPASGTYGGTRLSDLGIADDSAIVVEVECPAQAKAGPDSRWRAPGGFLIVKDPDHLFMVWEGTYFELARP